MQEKNIYNKKIYERANNLKLKSIFNRIHFCNFQLILRFIKTGQFKQ